MLFMYRVVMLLRLFIAALWSPVWKGFTFWLSFVMFNCVFVTFPCGILGQVCYLILLISDLCLHFTLCTISVLKGSLCVYRSREAFANIMQ